MIRENVGFEAEKPFLDLNKPFLDFAEIERLENQKILEDDLSEFQIIHGKIHELTYDTKLPDDVVRNGNSCSSSENARLVRAMTHTLEAVKTSIGNYNEIAFRRWFGNDNDR